jgi:hypothetical protein
MLNLTFTVSPTNISVALLNTNSSTNKLVVVDRLSEQGAKYLSVELRAELQKF